jgi:hypothetical protein
MLAASSQIIRYRTKNTRSNIEVRLERETIWTDAHQTAAQFQRDRTVMVRHKRNIFQTKALGRRSTRAKNAKVATDGKTDQVPHVGFDAVSLTGSKYLSLHFIR